MKIKYTFLSAVLTIALMLPLFGQNKHDDTTNTSMKMRDMSSMMGKPTVDAKVEGLHVKVWLITQKEHKEMMEKMMMHGERGGSVGKMDVMETKDTVKSKEVKGKKDGGMMMDRETKDAMMSGTHHIMVDATDATNGKPFDNASVKVLIVSPSGKESSIDLKYMMSHFGNGITLAEKGKYQCTVSVNANGFSRNKGFEYVVK